MPKRFTDTEKWKDDWYLSLNNDYRIIWQWLLDNCNHAGICKPSINLLNMMCNTSISESDLISIMNGRILKISNIWFIPKFLKFQYGTLNSKKPAVVSVVNELKKNDLFHLVKELLDNDCIMITEPLENSSVTIKDKFKDKDKDKDIIINKNGFFKELDFDELPEQYQRSIIEQMKIQKQKDIELNVVLSMWQIFKTQNLTGDKFYNNRNEVYRHFTNWIKTQKFEHNAKPANEKRFDAYLEFANRYKKPSNDEAVN